MTVLHLELTNRCTLACPACPRTEWANLLKRPVPKQDLTYSWLDQFLDCPLGSKVDTFLLCGDYGDCIYYPDLLNFIKHWRSTKKFLIATSGNGQTTEFWNSLAELLTENDTVTFAIDGLEDDNHLYRKNSNWGSIMNAVDILTCSRAKIRWQTIVFSFNQHKLNQISDFATSKGADFFHITTHRHGEQSLIPTNSQLIQTQYLFRNQYNHQDIEIVPQCGKNNTIATIGSDGIFYPCDWLRNPNTFYKSELWKQKSRWLDKLHIQNTTYDSSMEVIKDWANFVRTNSLTNGKVDVLCKMKCRKGSCK